MTNFADGKNQKPSICEHLEPRDGNSLAEEMGRILHATETDLGDERAVIRALIDARFKSGDVLSCIDDAIEIARRMASPSALGGVGDAVAMILFIATWLAAYCIVCPPGGA